VSGRVPVLTIPSLRFETIVVGVALPASRTAGVQLKLREPILSLIWNEALASPGSMDPSSSMS